MSSQPLNPGYAKEAEYFTSIYYRLVKSEEHKKPKWHCVDGRLRNKTRSSHRKDSNEKKGQWTIINRLNVCFLAPPFWQWILDIFFSFFKYFTSSKVIKPLKVVIVCEIIWEKY